MESDARFDRLEAKIDKLADAMTLLIMHGTKIETLEAHNNTQDRRLNKHSEEIDDNKVAIALQGKTSSSNEWFIRISIAALVSAAAFMLRSQYG